MGLLPRYYDHTYYSYTDTFTINFTHTHNIVRASVCNRGGVVALYRTLGQVKNMQYNGVITWFYSQQTHSHTLIIHITHECIAEWMTCLCMCNIHEMCDGILIIIILVVGALLLCYSQGDCARKWCVRLDMTNLCRSPCGVVSQVTQTERERDREKQKKRNKERHWTQSRLRAYPPLECTRQHKSETCLNDSDAGNGCNTSF